jgi:hypothetical protein
MRFKTVYAQARREGTDRRRFLAMWREHGAIAMKLDDYFGEVVRYVQSHAMATDGSIAGETRAYDGVGEIAFDTLESYRAANASKSREEIVLPHGRELFGGPNPISLIGSEHIAWFEHVASIKLYVFVRRQPGTTRDTLATTWQRDAERWAASGRAGARSYARTMALAPESEFDAVEEITFDTLALARRVFDDPRAFVRGIPTCGPTVRVLTHQVVMLDTDLF